MAKGRDAKKRQQGNQTAKEKAENQAKHREEEKRHLAKQSADERAERVAMQREAMKRQRANQTAEQRKVARAKDRQEKGRKCTKVQKKEAWKSQEIMNGTYCVPDLKDTVDDIGKMDTVCPHCGAFKFKKETATTR